MVISNPKEASNHRQFLLGCHITWTDILRNKQRCECRNVLQERLHDITDYAEEQQIKEGVALLDDEIRQWVLI